jgi:hypothetical protein
MRFVPMRRKPIPEAEIFASAVQDEISKTPQGDIFTDSMSFFIYSKALALMKQRDYTGIPPGAFNIGSSDSLPVVCQAYGMENAPAGLSKFLILTERIYEKKYDVHLGNFATAKIYGMGHYFPITLKRNTTLTLESGNARDSSINSGAASKGLVALPLRPIHSNRKSLLRLLQMDERSQRSLGRRGSSFSKT